MADERQNPFQTISVDLITDLPNSNGFDSILTIVDHGCSKAAIFLPCQKTIDAPGVAMLYAQRVFPFFGIPRRVISDRDPRFTAKFTTELCGILKIDQNLSTAYHPQMDGQSERANQRVEQYLRIYGNDEKNDWAELLPMAQYMHNAGKNESTQATPFELLIGHTPTIQVEEKDLAVPEIARRKEWLERGRLRAQAALWHAHRLLEQRTLRKKGERHY
jgi:transposase InsO family protein